MDTLLGFSCFRLLLGGRTPRSLWGPFSNDNAPRPSSFTHCTKYAQFLRQGWHPRSFEIAVTRSPAKISFLIAMTVLGPIWILIIVLLGAQISSCHSSYTSATCQPQKFGRPFEGQLDTSCCRNYSHGFPHLSIWDPEHPVASSDSNSCSDLSLTPCFFVSLELPRQRSFYVL